MNKKAIFGIVGVLLLLGGGGAVYFVERPGEAAAAETPAELATPVAVRIPFLAVPVIEAAKLRRYAIVSITMEMANQGDADAVKGDLPRIVDAFLDVFHVEANGTPIQDQAGEDADLTARAQAARPRLPDAERIRRIVISTNHPVPR